ncbi:MAG: hypothetical protein N4A35_10155 [Flavobacteriales bacterium]|nr:hypothetical protein [Flavobacteriales bacterium]
MPGRSGGSEEYRYSFQGQESDDEVKGKGNSINYKYRMHDSRLGRFFTVDPLTADYPHYTPYSFSGNKLIAWRELEGLEEYYAADGSYLGQVGDNSKIRVVAVNDIEYVKANILIANTGKGNVAIHAADAAYYSSEALSSSSAKFAVMKSILTNELGLPKKLTENVGMTNASEGLGVCFCDGKGGGYNGYLGHYEKPTIGVNFKGKVDFEDRNNLKTILLKESVHLSDNNQVNNGEHVLAYDLLAFPTVLKTSAWENSTKRFKQMYLVGASNILWDEYESRNIGFPLDWRTDFVNGIHKSFNEGGVFFDYSDLIKSYKGEYDYQGGNGQYYDANTLNHSIKVNGIEINNYKPSTNHK